MNQKDQLINTNNIFSSIGEKIKQNKSTIFLGIGVCAALYGLRRFRKRIHPDIRKVIKLRQIIQKSQPQSLKALQNLQIQKKIQTHYGKSQDLIGDQHQINMLYLLMTKLKIKQSNKQQQLRNPFLPPFQQGIFISQLQPSHRLIYNKYNIYKNHLIVITKQFQQQQNDITESDFKQSILVLMALEGLLFFNCGKDAGSSQAHKHIQIFPKQALQLPIIKQVQLFVKSLKQKYKIQQWKGKIYQFPGYNFVHGIVLLQPTVNISDSKKNMHNAYKLLLEQKLKPIQTTAYNLIATQQFIMVIPRKKQKAFDQIQVNSVGFMGSLLFKDQQKLNKYLSLKIKPSSILEDITYPKDYNPQQIDLSKGQQKPQLKQKQ